MPESTFAPTSPLDRPAPEFESRPFFAETCSLLRCVRDHDFDTLATLCDDDFGIVDVDPSGGSVAIRSRGEWEAWFHDLFATLTGLDAATDSEILAYDATTSEELGFSVLEFRQTLSSAGLTASFDCIATIVWKATPDGWREARWHASVLTAEVPEGFGPQT